MVMILATITKTRIKMSLATITETRIDMILATITKTRIKMILIKPRLVAVLGELLTITCG